MSTFSSDQFNRQVGQFITHGRRKAPIQIGASGVSAGFLPKLSSPRFSLSHTFTGLTPGVSVVLIDRLFSIEINDVWRSQIVRTGTVNSFGQITFDKLRDSIYSLLVVNLDYTNESIHDIPIGDPQRFDTVAKHAIPSTPYIFNTEYRDTGTTAEFTIFWRLGVDGVNGYPEVYYTISGANQWVLFNRYEDPNIYSATIQPLEYDTDYEFKLRLINEDLLGGPWSNIVSAASSDLSVSGSILPGSKKLILHLDFEDPTDLFKDTSGKNNLISGYGLSDYTSDSPLYGKYSYLCSSGVPYISVDSEDLYLTNTHPRKSLIVEGTFRIDAGLVAVTDYALFGGVDSVYAYITVNGAATHINNIRMGYGDTALIDIPIPTTGKLAWPLGEAKQLSLVYDASNASYISTRVFIDGLLVGSGYDASSTTVNTPYAFGIFGKAGEPAVSGYTGMADEFKVWVWQGDKTPDDSDSHIKATIPAPGVFNTGYDYPRATLNSNTYSGGSNPILEFYDVNSGVYAKLTSSGFQLDPDNATAGYAWISDANGYGSWQAVSGTSSSGLYNTALATGLAMPEAVGGYPAGTTVNDLLGNSFIQMFDDLLFPTVEAYISKSNYVTLAGVTTQTVEVGSGIAPSLVATYEPGDITNGDETAGPNLTGDSNEMRFFSPALAGIPPVVVPSSNIGNKSAPTYNVTFGSNRWYVECDYDAGSGSYYDNKSNTGSNLDASRASGTVTDYSNTVTGRYYYWYGYGTLSSAPTDSAGVRALSNKGFLGSSNTGTWDITIPGSTQEVYFYTISGKTVTVQYVESSYADVTGSFTKTGFQVNDGAGTPTNYESFVSYIGAGGYPATATYRVTVT